MRCLRHLHADAMQLQGFESVMKTMRRTIGTQLQSQVQTRLILNQCSQQMVSRQTKACVCVTAAAEVATPKTSRLDETG